MTEELSLYWSELCRSFDLPEDIRRYALLRFFVPFIQANKEFKLINECYLFCSNPINIHGDRIMTFIDFLGNPRILLDTRVIDNRLNVYISLIELFIPNRIGNITIDLILTKALEDNNLYAFEVAYQRNREFIQCPLFGERDDKRKLQWHEDMKPFIKRIVQQIQLNPTLFDNFSISFQERIVLSCLELEDSPSLALFLCMMDDIDDVKYNIIKDHCQTGLLKILQNEYKNKDILFTTG